jgi:hypothetical protein
MAFKGLPNMDGSRFAKPSSRFQHSDSISPACGKDLCTDRTQPSFLIIEMEIPLELIIAIACKLHGKDLANFRRVNRTFASAGLHAIASQGLSVLNTFDCLEELQELLEYRMIAHGTEELTIYHGEWPVCSREEWEMHPLLFGGNDRFGAAQETCKTDKAFADYLAFIKQEHHGCDKAGVMLRVLGSLRRLRTITISSMQNLAWHPTSNAKYYNLQQKIWIAPYYDNLVTCPLQTLLQALTDKVVEISTLQIQGVFNPVELHLESSSVFLSIQRLHIGSITVTEGCAARHFLLAFPNLTELSMIFEGLSPSPDVTGGLFYPRLRRLSLGDMWASEQDIFTLFERHRHTLVHFALNNATLTQGSWQSLFTRIRELGSTTYVTADGELYGRRRRETMSMHPSIARDLARFLQDREMKWPFDTIEGWEDSHTQVTDGA